MNNGTKSSVAHFLWRIAGNLSDPAAEIAMISLIASARSFG